MESIAKVGHLFNESIGVFKKKWKMFTALNATYGLLVLVSLLFMTGAVYGEQPTWPVATAAGVANVVFSVLLTLSAAYLIKRREEEVRLGELLRFGAANMGSGFWICLLTILIVAGGFMLLIVPGIIFSVWFSFGIYILVAEDIKGWAALKKSKELVKGKWWGVFWRIAAIWILYTVVLSLLSWLSPFSAIVDVFLLMPAMEIYLYLLYENLKKIKETA